MKPHLGHKPKLIGRWLICAVCQMTKRKRGWWKPCPGTASAKLYPVECDDDSWKRRAP